MSNIHGSCNNLVMLENDIYFVAVRELLGIFSPYGKDHAILITHSNSNVLDSDLKQA